ncbi:MAG: DUF3592 domain-containing protein [Armatimonadota bacterium]
MNIATLTPRGTFRRQVPLQLYLLSLFDGFMNQFGWLFFGFGLIAFWGLALHSTFWTARLFAGQLTTTQGRVVSTYDSGGSEGGSDGDRGTPIYAVEYEFTPAGDTHTLRNVSYILGEYTFSTGGTVLVEYRPNRPSISRIQGMRQEQFGPEVVFVTLFPLVGLAFITPGLSKGLFRIKLLVRGMPGRGQLVSVESTNTEVNDRPVMKMTFECLGLDGRTYTGTVCTHKPKESWVAFDKVQHPERFQDRRPAWVRRIVNSLMKKHPETNPVEVPQTVLPVPEEDMLCDPLNPGRSLVLADISPSLSLAPNGLVHGVNALTGVPATILPLLTVLGHGWYILHHFFKIG